MSLREVAKKIPIDAREIFIEKIVDAILSSSKAQNLPGELSKTILFYWQRDQLTSDAGIEKLLEAAMFLEPEATINTLSEEMGLKEAAEMLRRKRSGSP